MHKVLTVTSNSKTQQLVKNTILTMPDCFRLCGQFSNSIDALEIATVQKPDIVFFSDQMLFIGASQFIRSLTRKGVRALYIILKNTDEIISPEHTVNLIRAIVNENELTITTLQELLQQLDLELKSKESPSYYMENSNWQTDNYSFPWLQENQLFAHILNNPDNIDSIQSPVIACQEGYLLIGTPRNMPGENFSFFSNLQKMNAFYKNAKLLLESYGKGNLFIIQENKLCIWIEPSCSISRIDSFFSELCSSFHSIFEYHHVSQLGFQRSDTTASLTQLPQVYRAVDRVCKYRFFTDDQTILSSNWLAAHSETISPDDIQDTLNGLEQSFEHRDLTDFHNCIDDLFLYAQKSLSFNTYAHIWNQLIFWYNLKVQQNTLPAEQYIPTFGHTSFSRLQDAQQAIQNLMTNLYNATSTAHLHSGSYYISQAVSYLNAHITDSVTLSDTAEYIHINPAYLSQLFQKELGKSFVDVRTDLRINLAKDLLQKNYKIYEVALMAGFSNEKYFSQTFKKVTGMTPRSYKMQNEVNYEKY